MDLKGKTILLTGANGGIGTALGKLLAEQGCKLVLCSLSRESLEKLERDLAASGNTNSHSIIAADISSSEDRHRIASGCEALGGIDDGVNLCHRPGALATGHWSGFGNSETAGYCGDWRLDQLNAVDAVFVTDYLSTFSS